MADWVRLKAADGHEFDAYRAVPEGAPRGGVVIVQEIFGLTPHMLAVADQYAEHGFVAVAPAVFDRVERNIVYDYANIEQGRETMRRLEWPNTMADVAAAAAALGNTLRVGVVGFCWGGTVAHVAASELPIAAAVSYYGTAVARMLDRKPKCPVLYHFGSRDRSIPPADIERIREAVPHGTFHVYEGAEHGFDCRDRAAYSPRDAAVAFDRSLEFLRRHLGPAHA